ncbi:glycoside hydrolase family 38 C-terminal domain-containing protein [Rubellicoccus peritrichatus]|uniref:Glycoside hydrolase family 38 C-terminal domain-containing protein n=1 Tax=Rubellicoccus peritrichatus TaxID=3080537 RepID=A0AAQ3QSS2_9BACT|nr:glycoside hydrolase family 38 C-terminal domain-containing protein [Puniceicoccus sp. CR14]WOO42863.1 glycoside hydrolase family 38 C-terminal domain-containing protein [Puniceicoccus sp. CR14]
MKRNTFPQLSLFRLVTACEQIKNRLYHRFQDLEVKRLKAKPKAEMDAVEGTVLQFPYHWGRLWETAWFQIDLPNDASGKYLRWNDQAEAILHADGRPVYGFDPAHRYWQVPEGVKLITLEGRCCQSAIWHPDATGLDPYGSRLDGAVLYERHEALWLIYYDLLPLLEWLRYTFADLESPNHEFDKSSGRLPTLELVPPKFRTLLRRLDKVVDQVERDQFDSAQKDLKQIYKDFVGADRFAKALLTGHSHVDLVWLWPEHTGEAKSTHAFANVDYLMERYPEFRFAYSQPASYRAVSRRSPDLFSSVKKHMAMGRWEMLGGLWVESDTNLPCGEALSRCFSLGQKYFKDQTGAISEILWLPDTFGLSASVPSIAAQHGIRYFFGNKPTWNRIHEFPLSSFDWVGPDGSSLLTHVCRENIQSYNGLASVREVAQNADANRQGDVFPEYLLPTGFGDGGGGPTEEMCEYARRLKDLAGLPSVQWSSVSDFFETFSESKDELPSHYGEIFLECHLGVFTTNSNLKAAYRRAERALQFWEAVRVIGGKGAIEDHYWERLTFAQFHDCVTGAAIYEVTSAFEKELNTIADEAEGMGQSDLPSGGTSAVLNPFPLARLYLSEGEKPKMIPPLCVAEINDLPSVDLPVVEATETMLSNGLVRIEFNSKGEVSAFSRGEKSMPINEALGRLSSHVERSNAFPAWDIPHSTMNDFDWIDNEVSSISVRNISEHKAEVAFKKSICGDSAIILTYSLEAGSPVVRLNLSIDWNEQRRLLKMHFPTEYYGRLARFGSAFGSVTRNAREFDAHDAVQWEVPGSRWAAISYDGEYEGLALMAKSKYGFSCRDGDLAVSLLRSVPFTCEETHLQAAPASLRPEQNRPHLIDLGHHEIELAFSFYDAGASRDQLPATLSETLWQPMLGIESSAADAGFLGLEGGDSLVPTWACPHDDGSWTLRLHETQGRAGYCKLLLREGYAASRERLGGASIEAGFIDEIAFDSYAIVSVRIGRK